MMRRIGKVKLTGKFVAPSKSRGADHIHLFAEWLKTPNAVPVSLTLPLRENVCFTRLHPSLRISCQRAGCSK